MKFTPMLAEIGSKDDLSRDGWLFEPKFDGIRVIVRKRGSEISLTGRSGSRIEAKYPELLDVAKNISAKSCVLDAELVILNSKGIPSFEAWQEREAMSKNPGAAAAAHPALLMAFDLLELDGKSIMNKPLSERKKLLGKTVKDSDSIAKTVFSDDGKKLFVAMKKLGFEGVVAKRRDSRYVTKRSSLWLKIKFVRTIDCIIVGYTPGNGRRSGAFGALALGAYHGGRLLHIGNVGTGWGERDIAAIYGMLKKDATKKPAVDNPRPGIRWLKPRHVCEVEYLEVTKAIQLRAPSFKRLRSDKPLRDCVI